MNASQSSAHPVQRNSFTPSPVLRPPLVRSPRLLAVLWLLLLFSLWVIGLTAAVRPLALWGEAAAGSRAFAMALILGIVTLASFLPVLLVGAFFWSERDRTVQNTLTAARHYGWAAQFQDEIREWYATVFTSERYPIPVTLALATFLLGWIFIFFHDGPSVVRDLAMRWELSVFLEHVARSPAVGYAFLGAYFFSAAFLFRRYMSGDLGPAVFIYICMRTWVVVILGLVLATIWQGVPLKEPASTFSDQVLLALLFVGGLTPDVLLELIWGVVRRGLAKAVGRPWTEVSLSELQGLNPWKAARLHEEGVDNVQNLAMEDPSKLVVVTQESGLRILDWVDQAVIYNAVGHRQAYEKLIASGVRTAYDLYLAFREGNLITEQPGLQGRGSVYRVAAPAGELFADAISPGALRNIMLTIIHHPNFEKIKQMREQATRTATGLFTTLGRTVSPQMEPARTRALAPERPPTEAEAIRGAVVVVSLALQGDPVAMGVLVDERTVITIIDLPARDVRFATVQAIQQAGEGKRRRALRAPRGGFVEGDVIAEDEASRLLVFRLARALDSPATLAAADPRPGATLYRYSSFSGYSSGPVESIGATVQVQVPSRGSVDLAGVIIVRVPASPGDGGAALLNDVGEVAAILVAGTPELTVAVPVSTIRRLLNR